MKELKQQLIGQREEIIQANIYISKINALTGTERAKEIIENAKQKAKTSTLSYTNALENEFMKLLDGSEIENKTNIMEINFNGKIEDISI